MSSAWASEGAKWATPNPDRAKLTPRNRPEMAQIPLIYPVIAAVFRAKGAKAKPRLGLKCPETARNSPAIKHFSGAKNGR